MNFFQVLSQNFIGYFIGANAVPNLVGKVGHIRVFAAFASMASLSILIHAVIVNPYIFNLNNKISICWSNKIPFINLFIIFLKHSVQYFFDL